MSGKKDFLISFAFSRTPPSVNIEFHTGGAFIRHYIKVVLGFKQSVVRGGRGKTFSLTNLALHTKP